ncbi:MFS transporter [Acetonema longum]|uniref:Putative multidrug resistance protein n=1 Tax=Acetonema longum DSM 6540 TaxID=1009370 RepID=F7NQ41_9FIRM|nr:MFS transporter [Acetonema longum]EGO61800.1 putative multidrug resistance protein [Acetonema longum DSM 6540]
MFNWEVYTPAFISLIFANMFFWMSTNFFLPVLPVYYHGLGMNDSQVGLAIGAFAVGAVSFRLFAGKAVDRYGSVRIIAVGIVLSIGAIISYRFSHGLESAVLSRFLHGVGISTYAGAALTMASLMHEEKHTAEAVAAYTLFSMIGVGIASSTANILYQAGGILWVIVAGVTATFMSLLLFPKEAKLKIKPVAADSLPIRTVIANPGIYVPTASLLAVSLCFGTAMTFLPLLMISRGIYGLSAFYASYAVAVVVSRFWVKSLCDRLTAQRLSLYILGLFAVIMLLIEFSSSPWMLVIAGIGLGIGYGLAFPSMATIITASTQPANRGTAFGFYTMAVDVGFAAGAMIMGNLASHWGYETVFAAAACYTLTYMILYQVSFRRLLAVKG